MRKCSEIDDHFGLLGIEQLAQPVLLEHCMDLLVLVARIAFAHVQCVGRGTADIASHANDLARIGMLKEVFGRMYREHAGATQQDEGLQRVFLPR